MTDPILEKQRKRLIIAIDEAERFVRRAREAVKALDTVISIDTRKTAAAKRSSMDLSRALSDVRRNPYVD